MSLSSPTRGPPTPFEAAGNLKPLASEAPTDAFLFEIAWEVCNQVGGIYQVVRSKVPLMVERWHERYCLIGPYVEGKAQLELEPAPPSGWLASVIETVERAGLKVHHGYWLIQGKPRVLLLEHQRLSGSLDELKAILQSEHGIFTEQNEPLVDAAITFGDAVRRVLDASSSELARAKKRKGGNGQRLLAHFHEWQAGIALPILQRASLEAVEGL